MKILIGGLTQFLGVYGGVERVVINFANEMQKRGHAVSVFYCTDIDGKVPYPLHSEVRLVNLFQLGAPGNEFWHAKRSLAFKIRREIIRLFNKAVIRDVNFQFILDQYKCAVEKCLKEENPDILITIDSKTTAAFEKTAAKYGIPLLTMTHFDVETAIEWMSGTEVKAIDRCAALQVLMPHDLDAFRRVFSKVPMIWIPNVVPQYNIKGGEKISKSPVIINVARLEKQQKRQHLLIEAFAKISNIFPDWNVEIWGIEKEESKGEYTGELRELLEKFHLQNRVKLCGVTDDILSVYQRASILAFPSAWEGFPLAMTEAMSAGLPVVAYRSCPAVNELVKDGETGILVEDGVDAFAEGMQKLIENRELREKMGVAAHESMKEFAPEKVWNQWEDLMKDIIGKYNSKNGLV